MTDDVWRCLNRPAKECTCEGGPCANLQRERQAPIPAAGSMAEAQAALVTDINGVLAEENKRLRARVEDLTRWLKAAEDSVARAREEERQLGLVAVEKERERLDVTPSAERIRLEERDACAEKCDWEKWVACKDDCQCERCVACDDCSAAIRARTLP